MINLDDRILSKLSANELFLLLQIVKRMRVNKMVSWPSIELLAKECNWDERTVKTWRSMLIKKGYIHMELRPGKPTLYRLRKTGIGVYHGVDSDTGVEEEAGEGTKNDGVQNLPKKRVQKMRGQGVQNLPPELVNQELLNNGRGLNEKTTPTREDFNALIDERAKRLEALREKHQEGTDSYHLEHDGVEAEKEKAPSIAGGFPIEPTHTITTIEPGNPVTIVEGINIEPGNPNATTALFNRMGLQPKAANGDEADALIVAWAKENIETVKMKYNRAKRNFTPSDLDKLIVKFCGQYASNKDTGTMQRFLYDPARFFNDKLSAWLVDQPGFEKMAERISGTAQPETKYIAPTKTEKIGAYTP